jgi:hypothetical protein
MGFDDMAFLFKQHQVAPDGFLCNSSQKGQAGNSGNPVLINGIQKQFSALDSQHRSHLPSAS